MHGYMSYGQWDFADGISHGARYLEPVVNTKQHHFFQQHEEEDLFKVQAPTAEPISDYHCCRHRYQVRKFPMCCSL